MINPILDPKTPETHEFSLRPKKFNEFIGQKKIVNNAMIFIKSALSRKVNLDHVLLYGPPGLGKTTIAQIIANELNCNFKSTSGPILAKAGDIAAILTSLNENDILFIDEIHRLNTHVEEILYSAMEDFHIDIIIGEGPAARSIKIDLPKFTLIGATTRIGLLSNPLKDRFGIPLKLEFYERNDLKEILFRAASFLNIELSDEGATQISTRCRGTPRIAIRILKRVVDYAVVYNHSIIDQKIADIALKELNIDNLGLDTDDIKYLKYILDHYNGGPVGIETIAAGLVEQRDNIEETVEPFLMQIGMLQRTAKGRVLTQNAINHLVTHSNI